MGDELLSQDAIDSLLSQMSSRPAQASTRSGNASFASPAPPPATALSGGPAAPGPRGASLQSQTGNVPAPLRISHEAEARVAELMRRLEAVEEEIGRLRDLPRLAQELQASLSNVLTGLQGTPGYGIRHTFKCDKCQGIGMVAAAFTCTKCGHQALRGWGKKR